MFTFQGSILGVCLLLGTVSACSAENSSRLSSVADQNQTVQTSTLEPLRFWVDPYSQAMEDAVIMQPSQSADAKRIQYIADQAAAVWYGEWSEDITEAVNQQIQAAAADQSYAILIAYNIPHRDCGQHSAGGASASAYRVWIQEFARAIASAKTFVILEPDALTLNNCLSEELKQERYELLRYAIELLKQNPATKVFIDAGHSAWLSAEETAARLQMAGIAEADGFALNTSNYQTTESNVQFGQKLQAIVGTHKQFVIDTSRNGHGPSKSNEWCNPRGRALGQKPSSQTGIAGLAAFLWLKRPGESDGLCNGGPAAGMWWREIALELARNAGK